MSVSSRLRWDGAKEPQVMQTVLSCLPVCLSLSGGRRGAVCSEGSRLQASQHQIDLFLQAEKMVPTPSVPGAPPNTPHLKAVVPEQAGGMWAGPVLTCLLEQRLPAFLTVQSQPGRLWLELVATTQTLESAHQRVPCFPELTLSPGGCRGQHSKQLLKQAGRTQL